MYYQFDTNDVTHGKAAHIERSKIGARVPYVVVGARKNRRR